MRPNTNHAASAPLSVVTSFSSDSNLNTHLVIRTALLLGHTISCRTQSKPSIPSNPDTEFLGNFTCCASPYRSTRLGLARIAALGFLLSQSASSTTASTIPSRASESCLLATLPRRTSSALPTISTSLPAPFSRHGRQETPKLVPAA